jgi:signal peptidase II
VNRKTIVFLSVFVIGVILDQATKIWVYTNLEYRRDEIKVIDGFFSIVHAQNPGAAFGMFGDLPFRQYLFLIFVAIAIGIVIDLWRRLPPNDNWLSLTLGLILSGAVGNGIDRVHKQTVTDFAMVYTEVPWIRDLIASIQMGPFHFCNSVRCEWPSFNVADASLLVGVGLFMVHYMIWGEEDEMAKEAAATDDDAATTDEVTTDSQTEDDASDAEVAQETGDPNDAPAPE